MSEKYSIGKLAKIAHVTTRTLRYYDQKGLVKPERVDQNGYRIYADTQLKKVQLIKYLERLGLSLKQIQKVLNDQNGKSSINLLLEGQIEQNKQQLQNLKQRQKVLVNLHKVLMQKGIHIQKVTDIKNIMDNETKLRKVRNSLIKVAMIALIIEILGILIAVYSFICQQNVLAWIIIGIMVIVLLFMAALITHKYYLNVAYICPNCRAKFVPTLRSFMWAEHTPKMRKLRCPNCHHKSYCLEVFR